MNEHGGQIDKVPPFENNTDKRGQGSNRGIHKKVNNEPMTDHFLCAQVFLHDNGRMTVMNLEVILSKVSRQSAIDFHTSYKCNPQPYRLL